MAFLSNRVFDINKSTGSANTLSIIKDKYCSALNVYRRHKLQNVFIISKFISLDKTLSASKERIIVEKAKKHEH